jgi:hypothetical protein
MYLAHGFFSPLRLLNICQINVNSRGFGGFVYYLGADHAIIKLNEKQSNETLKEIISK